MKAISCIGLGFGDESKGSATDALCREYPVDLIVRFNGGCQTAHHVTLGNGHVHGFSQFGSGMLANSSVKTHLSHFTLVEPIAMMHEADALSTKTDNVWGRITVDPKCPITTPIHAYLNRLREQSRGNACHGSCGRGIGVTRELQIKYGDDKILLAADIRNPNYLFDKLRFLQSVMEPEIRELEGKLGIHSSHFNFNDLFRSLNVDYHLWRGKNIVQELDPYQFNTFLFEGAQGVMLDETHGMAPHNTWTDTTFNNADTILDEWGVDDRTRIGCLRSYYTRHGAGPFPTEDNTLDLPEPHNGNDGFQGQFRTGHFDFALARTALSIVGSVDYLAISHLDYLPRLNWDEEDFITCVEARLRTPIGMRGYGPTAADRKMSMDKVYV